MYDFLIIFILSNSNTEEEEPNVHFEPVLEKLPELVQEQTGEEGETITFHARGKLYIYKYCDINKDHQWKERGLGPAKILQNRNSFQTRIVMRREQVKKVCLNLPLGGDSPSIDFKANTQEKALTFVGMDFR